MFREILKRICRAFLPVLSQFSGLWNVNPAIPVVFVMGVGTMLLIAAAEWTLLLYLNHIGFTNATDSSFYIYTFSMALVVPIIANVVLGFIASFVGPGITLAWGYLFVAVGMLLLVFSRFSRSLFLIGYAMYACATSFRVIRLSIISMVVNSEYRTTVMAGHQLMAPIGALLGPLLWFLLQLWQGHIVILSETFVVDRFVINYTISGLVMIAMSVLAFKKLSVIRRDEEDYEQEESETRKGVNSPLCKSKHRNYGTSMQRTDARKPTLEPLPKEVTICLANGCETKIDVGRYRIKIFAFFSIIFLGVSLTMGIIRVAFQPILINHFKADDAKVATIFFIIAILALIPPIMVAALSRIMQDRQILLFGLSLKLIGTIMFLPSFGPEVLEWQVVMGFVLLVKGSNFFTTATISLFTKVLGRMGSGTLLSWLWSVANIGPAVAQIMLSTTILERFGGWSFAVFGMPGLFSLALVLSPWGWKLLDPGREMTHLVLTAINKRRHESKEVKMTA